MKEDIIIKQGSVVLPSKFGKFDLTAYAADANEQMPHLVLKSDNIDLDDIVNVRLHSECITGDLFGSLRCDCGDQLSKALNYITKNGGVLIYLRQEGRGIGIINKIKAYVEQDKGCNTAEANQKLGFGIDERRYGDAIQILLDLGIKKINLLTNNPEKIKAFEGSGIIVESRTRHEISPNKVNESYLKTKKDIFGHLLESI